MHRSALGWVVVLLVGISGCKREADAPAQVAPTAPATAAAAAKPRVHPCDMLPDAAVAGAVAGAMPGQRDAADEAQGISACRWAAGDGSVALQVFDVGPGALPQELRASSLEIVDIRRPDAASIVRLEKLADIGDLAGAYVEREDTKRGVRRSNAVLMVQRGDRMAVLRIPQIAAGDRDAALETLETLGAAIAGKL